MMSRGAGFHADQARNLLLKELFDLGATERKAGNNLSVCVYPVNLEDVLSKIETNGDNGHVDGPPVCGDSTPTTLWHFDAGGSGRPHHQLLYMRYRGFEIQSKDVMLRT
jgi:hypothetical protein